MPTKLTDCSGAFILCGKFHPAANSYEAREREVSYANLCKPAPSVLKEFTQQKASLPVACQAGALRWKTAYSQTDIQTQTKFICHENPTSMKKMPALLCMVAYVSLFICFPHSTNFETGLTIGARPLKRLLRIVSTVGAQAVNKSRRGT